MSSQLPTAIAPKYSAAQVNGEILLYDGPITLNKNGTEVDGNGKLLWVWLPNPRVRFEWEPKPRMTFHPLPGDYHIQINGYQDTTAILIGSPVSLGKIYGYLTAPFIESQKETKFVKVKFHVPNYDNYYGTPIAYQSEPSRLGQGRLTFVTNGWRINLDQTEEWGHPNEGLHEETRRSGGNAISHVGVLERIDGNWFSSEDSGKILNIFRLFLSFALGRWTSPILLVGIDDTDTEYCQCEAARLDRYEWRYSWLPQYPRDIQQNINEAWQGFNRLAEEWNDKLAVCIEWYLQANGTDVPATGIVFAQAALELLFHLVISEPADLGNIDKVRFSDTLHMLLFHCQIAMGIPRGLTNLTKSAKESNWTDGPHAINEIRNSIMHGSKVERLIKADTLVLNEIRHLALWYVERVLVWKMGCKCAIADARIGG